MEIGTFGAGEGHQLSGGSFDVDVCADVAVDIMGHFFTSDYSGRLHSVALNLYIPTGSTITDETLTVSVYAISGGFPAVTLGSVTVNASDLALPHYEEASAVNTLKVFTFDAPPLLSIGTKYALAVAKAGLTVPKICCQSTLWFNLYTYYADPGVWGPSAYSRAFLYDLAFTGVTNYADVHQVQATTYSPVQYVTFDYPTGQIFTAGYTELVKAVGIRLGTGSNQTVYDGDISIQITGTMLDGQSRVIPNSNDVLCSVTIPATSLTLFAYAEGAAADTAYNPFVFDTPAQLTSGTQYAFVISSTGTVFPQLLIGDLIDFAFPIWKLNGTWEISASYPVFFDLFLGITGESDNNATVTYDSNGATEGTVPSPTVWESGNPSGQYVSYNTGYLAKTSFSFVGWNTSSAGDGTFYSEAELVAPWFSQDLTLYAQWTPATYATVTYDGNGATEGTVPDPTVWESGSPSGQYLSYNTGYLAKTDVTFIGWNTSLDGTGIYYLVAELKVPWFYQDITLYAYWIPAVPVTLTFDGNGSDLGEAPPPVIHDAGEQLDYNYLTPYGVRGLGRVSYLFTGWNTKEDGSGTPYENNVLIPTWFTEDTTLYAQWQSGYITLIYDGNGATGGYPPAPRSVVSGDSGTVWIEDNSNWLVKTGFSFHGWNTSTDGSGTTYTSVSPWFTQTTTIYAIWVGTATVTFDGNGATSGSLPSQTYDSGYPSGAFLTPYQQEYPNEFKKTGFIFAGWNTETDGSGTAYPDNGHVQPWFDQNTTLYAQWIAEDAQVTVTFNGNGSDQGAVPTSQTHTAGAYDGWFLPAANSNGLGKNGSFFSGWNTEANGSGDVYYNEQLMAPWFLFDITLYAQWKTNVSGWTSTTAPVEPRAAMSSAVIGTKAIFAGGATGSAAWGPFTDRVDVYDSITGNWTSITPLSHARYHMASAVVGSKVLFAGGLDSSVEYDAVDIYDFTNPESPVHSTSVLPVSVRHGMCSAVVGTRAIFAGGYNLSHDLPEVVVYDSATSSWSTITPLSIGRSFLASAVVSSTYLGTPHTFVLFGGGYTGGGYQYSDVIDVYDFTDPSAPVLMSRTAPSLPSVLLGGARAHLASAVIGSMVIFAGGEVSNGYFGSAAVDVFDMSTGTFLTNVPELSVARSTLVPAVVGNSVMFAGGLKHIAEFPQVAGEDTVDVYDFTIPTAPTLTSTVLPLGPRAYMASAVLSTSLLFSNKLGADPEQIVLFAGGDAGGIYGPAVPDVDIFTGEVPPVETGSGIIISREGSVWRAATTAPEYPWRAVCWSPYLHLFCTVASTGQIATSPDGLTWTLRAFTSTFTDWQAICWSPELEKFCGLAYAGNALASITSSDGIIWTEHAITFDDVQSKHVFDLCWSPELRTFCAVGNRILLSTDGISWEVIRTIRLTSVCWSSEEHLFCAVSSDDKNLMTSETGRIWLGRSDVPKSIKVTWSPELRAFSAGKDAELITLTEDVVTMHNLPVDYGSWRSSAWSPELTCICIIGNPDAILTLY